jgi:hypothetical protein
MGADDLIIHIVVKRPFLSNTSVRTKAMTTKMSISLSACTITLNTSNIAVGAMTPKDACAIPGEKGFPARRWVVERTLGWCAKTPQHCHSLVQEVRELARIYSHGLRSSPAQHNFRIDT